MKICDLIRTLVDLHSMTSMMVKFRVSAFAELSKLPSNILSTTRIKWSKIRVTSSPSRPLSN